MLSFSLNSQAGHGLASVTVGGNFSYTAVANYWGPDQFSYSLTGPEGSNRYLVFVNVLPINDGAPVAANATYIVPTTAPFNGQLPGSTDVDGDAVTYSLGLDPSKGVATVSANGGFSYLGNANAFGDDSFTYLVSDGNGGSNTYTVTVKAGLVATEDTVLQLLLPDPVGLLRTAVTYSLAANAGHGNVSVSAQGLLVYTPAANYFGSDAFAYNLTGPGGVTRVDVALRVTSVNDGPPVASASAFEVNEDVLYIGSLPSAIDPDNTAITYSLGSAGAHGTVTIQANGQFSFLPAANYVGSDSFSYTVTDAEGGQNSYPVAVTIRPVNDAPTSSNASAQVNEDALLSANLPAAADVDGDALSYSRATNAGHGDVTINANGSYVYTPAANYNGPDSFTFKISDVLGAFSTYTLTITINPVNDAPVSSDGSDLSVIIGSIRC